jgi:hypothetical protein
MIKTKAQPDAIPVSVDNTRARIDIMAVMTGDQSVAGNQESGPDEFAEDIGQQKIDNNHQ